MTWEWNAAKNGSIYDCRLCFSDAPSHIWSSCRDDCKNIPTTLEDMKCILSLVKTSGSDSWLRSTPLSRKRLDNRMRNNKPLAHLLDVKWENERVCQINIPFLPLYSYRLNHLLKIK